MNETNFKKLLRYVKSASDVNWLKAEYRSAQASIAKRAETRYGTEYRHGLQLSESTFERLKEVSVIKNTDLSGRFRNRESRHERLMRNALIDLITEVEKMDISMCEKVQSSNVQSALVRAREAIIKNTKAKAGYSEGNKEGVVQ